ncbi:hypothetical protein [Pedobacter hiemivivus]|uniref:Outer membrane protein beta-barrel domain-containing protein n=1 Tax=Pedobacter hiemivivus TaxID=2530454 RepID=A0A4R0N851_9SPHI|nr:hypothetical protein [Pedobacter hiemivivus]TCC96250.1 hypothetical protein EZ444_12490 [Pedobacter hiemivivus]
MKKQVLIMLSLLLSSTAFSQINGDYNYSIAVRGYNLMQMPRILNQKEVGKLTETSFHSGMLKFNDNQISYRLSGSYLKKNVQIVNNCLNCEEANGKMTDYSFKLGFEKNLNFSRIQPYFGFDVGYRYNKFEGTLVSKNPIALAAEGAALSPTGAEASKSGFIASPVMGLKINPIPQVTLFAEASLDFFVFYERQETVTLDINNTRTFNKYNKSEFLLNPISIGIQVNIGSNR